MKTHMNSHAESSLAFDRALPFAAREAVNGIFPLFVSPHQRLGARSQLITSRMLAGHGQLRLKKGIVVNVMKHHASRKVPHHR
jgi:hypothetical protein